MNDKQIKIAEQINEELPDILNKIEAVKTAHASLKRMLKLLVTLWGLSLIVFLLKDNLNNTLDSTSFYQAGLYLISLIAVLWSKAI